MLNLRAGQAMPIIIRFSYIVATRARAASYVLHISTTVRTRARGAYVRHNGERTPKARAVEAKRRRNQRHAALTVTHNTMPHSVPQKARTVSHTAPHGGR